MLYAVGIADLDHFDADTSPISIFDTDHMLLLYEDFVDKFCSIASMKTLWSFMQVAPSHGFSLSSVENFDFPTTTYTN
jgi:hypothetical protein